VVLREIFVEVVGSLRFHVLGRRDPERVGALIALTFLSPPDFIVVLLLLGTVLDPRRLIEEELIASRAENPRNVLVYDSGRTCLQLSAADVPNR
jgi:hypothetical protein